MLEMVAQNSFPFQKTPNLLPLETVLFVSTRPDNLPSLLMHFLLNQSQSYQWLRSIPPSQYIIIPCPHTFSTQTLCTINHSDFFWQGELKRGQNYTKTAAFSLGVTATSWKNGCAKCPLKYFASFLATQSYSLGKVKVLGSLFSSLRAAVNMDKAGA